MLFRSGKLCCLPLICLPFMVSVWVACTACQERHLVVVVVVARAVPLELGYVQLLQELIDGSPLSPLQANALLAHFFLLFLLSGGDMNYPVWALHVDEDVASEMKLNIYPLLLHDGLEALVNVLSLLH